MPSVSICILARDEQDFLPACLASVAGATEVLLVDTGSQDDTIDIAVRAGARVMRMAWPSDFAVVRSAAAAAATGDWILFLDADERLVPGAMAAIREAIHEGVVVGLLPITNADSMDAELVDVAQGRNALGEAVLQPRLLRRDVAQSWSYGVCEVPDVDLARATELTAHIVHFGACHHPRNTLRNAPELWLRRAAAWPDDAAVQAEAARRLRIAGRNDEANLRARAAWDLAIGAGGCRRGLVQAAMVRTLLLLDDGKFREARHVLEHARRLGAGHPNLDLLVGLCAIEL
ncbi:MAG: glycosyltransferase involved in cell wall biosynthesis, partial [Kiritimatiellia bacterium]